MVVWLINGLLCFYVATLHYLSAPSDGTVEVEGASS